MRVEDREHIPVHRVAQLGEDSCKLVLEPEAQTQYTQRTITFGNAERVHQRALAIGQQIEMPISLDVSVAGRQCFMDESIVARGDSYILSETREHFAPWRQQDHILIHGILGDILAEALFQLLASASEILLARPAGGMFARLTQEVADIGVGAQKADVGRALVQIAHHDVDGDLSFGPQCQQCLAMRLGRESVDQLAGEYFERLARTAHVRGVAAEMREQGERVPRALQRRESSAVLLDGRHVFGDGIDHEQDDPGGTVLFT